MSVDCRTDCPIIGGGLCPRHQMVKPAHWVRLCVAKDNYFEAWEVGKGPGQRNGATQTKKRSGLGDWLHDWLAGHGITEERYVEVKQLFGLPPTCGCRARQEWLNKVGRWLQGE